ncbi:MAG TPA: FMN-binding protein [Candidatus Nanopelagicales bacterium]|nr:FMN-binding protein [Candidatus Nanopelagicales bacterium]
MPRRGAAALLLTTAALALLLSFKTPSDPTPTAGTPVAATGGATPTSAPAATQPSAPMPSASTAPAPAAPANAGLRDGTIDGAVVDTRWGTVQVQVTISGGAITDVTALQLPSGDQHSADISSRVEPLLRSSALVVQGAEIDVVSGATYTSLAYAQSLQAALDAARA